MLKHYHKLLEYCFTKYPEMSYGLKISHKIIDYGLLIYQFVVYMAEKHWTMGFAERLITPLIMVIIFTYVKRIDYDNIAKTKLFNVLLLIAKLLCLIAVICVRYFLIII